MKTSQIRSRDAIVYTHVTFKANVSNTSLTLNGQLKLSDVCLKVNLKMDIKNTCRTHSGLFIQKFPNH